MTTRQTGMSLFGSKLLRRWICTLLWSIGSLIVLVTTVALNPTAREVAGETARTVFQILTSPFVLEASLALIGLCIVIVINHYRQQREGDGWVYLQKQEQPPPVGDALKSDPPHRHEAVVWNEKPAVFDEAGTEFDMIDGYLDLGLIDEALQEMGALPAALRTHARAEALGIRASVIAGRSSAARDEMDAALQRHPDQTATFSAVGLAAASWLQQNEGSQSEIMAWLDKVRQMQPQAIRDLASNDPLRAYLAS